MNISLQSPDVGDDPLGGSLLDPVETAVSVRDAVSRAETIVEKSDHPPPDALVFPTSEVPS
jgi:hypothetical protein